MGFSVSVMFLSDKAQDRQTPRDQGTNLKKDAMWTLKAAHFLLTILQRRVKWYLKKISSDSVSAPV